MGEEAEVGGSGSGWFGRGVVGQAQQGRGMEQPELVAVGVRAADAGMTAGALAGSVDPGVRE